MKKLIVSAETVLPVSSKPLKNSALLIAGAKIREIGKASEIRKRHKDTEELKLGKGVLLPGFVNAHVHLELGWIKNKIGTFKGFSGWLGQIVKGKRRGVSDEELIHSVRGGIEALIRTGVTTVAEISSYGGIDKPLLRASGLRTVLYREVLDSNEDEEDFVSFERGELFEERLFPHAPYSCRPELLGKTLESHKKNGIPIGIHLAESSEEVKFVRGDENAIEKEIYPLIDKKQFEKPSACSPVSYLKRLGLFNGTKITTVHMVQVSEEETKELGRLHAGIVLCPRSNLFLQVGAPPVNQYADYERLGIGTDGLSSNYNLDFFEELRFLHLLMSQALGDRAAYRTVYTATLGGAKSLFLEDRTGSIEAGKEADLIFLNSKNESKDPYLTVISAGAENVELVMAGGKILYSGNPKYSAN